MSKGSVYGERRTLETDVYTESCRRIEQCFRQADKVVVCFSGGKDSTAVLNCALDVATRLNRLPLDVFFGDEEFMMPETFEYIMRVYNDPRVRMVWSCVPILSRNACSRSSPFWLSFDPACPEKWLRQPPEFAWTAKSHPHIPHRRIPEQIGYFYPPATGTVIQLLGRRAQESITRWRMIANRGGDEAYITKEAMPEWDHIRTCDPIYDWQTVDVWTAPHIKGWDYNRVYEKFTKMGIPLSSQRLAPPYAEEPMKQLWMYAMGWPELWDKMQERVPGAATAARLATTKVYATPSGSLNPMPGETWQAFVTRLLMLWPVEYRSKVSSNIVKMINMHDSKCMQYDGVTSPIPEVTPHARSGVSWAVLAKIAKKGVFKGRTLANLMGPRNYNMDETPVEDKGES